MLKIGNYNYVAVFMFQIKNEVFVYKKEPSET